MHFLTVCTLNHARFLKNIDALQTVQDWFWRYNSRKSLTSFFWNVVVLERYKTFTYFSRWVQSKVSKYIKLSSCHFTHTLFERSIFNSIRFSNNEKWDKNEAPNMSELFQVIRSSVKKINRRPSWKKPFIKLNTSLLAFSLYT